MYLTIQTHKQ